MVMKKQEQIRRLKLWVKKFGIEEDLIDWESEVDATLEFFENKTQLREKIKSLLPNIPRTKQEVEIMPQRQYEELVIQEIQKQEKQADLEFDLSIQKLLKEKNKEQIINKIFEIPIEYTKSVIKGYHNSFIFLGKQGQGKTTIVLKTLKKEKADYIYHSGISTPRALFEFLYHHRDGKTIVFDDCAGLINNFYAFSILLSALWSSTNKRIINWNSTKSAKVSIPSKYIFNSKIIVITNKMPLTDYADIVLSRCLTYEINLSYKEIIKMMYAIGDREVVDEIKNHSSEATKNFDLRLLRKAEKFKEYDKNNWKELIKPMLEVDEYLELIVQGLSCNEWIKKTHLSRRTYFRKKREINYQKI